MIITSIFRYPLKGFGADALATTMVQPNSVITGDRKYAITHSASAFNYLNPAWISRKNFLVIARSPLLATIKLGYYDESRGIVTLWSKGKLQLSHAFDDPDINIHLNMFLGQFASKHQPGPYELVTLGKVSLTDSPSQTISIMSEQSLHDLENKTGWQLDKSRFRGNIWVDGGNS